MSPYLMTAIDLAALSDGDSATASPRAADRRATITVAQAEQAAVLADPDHTAVLLLGEFRAAWSTGDETRMSDVVRAVVDLDQATPGAPRLMDEIRGISYPAAA